MLSFLPRPVTGVISAILFLLNILTITLTIIILGLIKFIVPFKRGRRAIEVLQINSVSVWIDLNNAILNLGSKIDWNIHGKGELKPNHWYFVFANHRSWIDILVLQKVFNRKIPLLMFFMKQELLWSLPFGGLACWMLGFPFMKRYSKAKIRKNPDLRNKDIETTKLACNKFKKRPTAVISFLEGTRFTAQKQQERSSPYQYLLRPKAGGLAFVVNELKDYIKEVIDVTLIYDHPDPSFWNLLCGRVKKITVHYQVIPLDTNQYGDYYNNSKFRKEIQGWVNTRWHEKDAAIAQLEGKQEA